MKKLALLVALAVGTAVSAVAAQAGPLNRAASLPVGWWHAEINVVIKRAPHTLIYDRGKVQSVSAAAITLKERDGSIVTITLDLNTRVTMNGAQATSADIQRGGTATTVSLDGAAARSVFARITPAQIAAIARQDARLARKAARQATQTVVTVTTQPVTTTTTGR